MLILSVGIVLSIWIVWELKDEKSVLRDGPDDKDLRFWHYLKFIYLVFAIVFVVTTVAGVVALLAAFSVFTLFITVPTIVAAIGYFSPD